MHKKFINTAHKLRGAKYFLDTIKSTIDSRKINIQIITIQIEAYCFFLKAVGTSFDTDLKIVTTKLKKAGRHDIVRKLENIAVSNHNLLKANKIYSFITNERNQIKLRPARASFKFELVRDGKFVQDLVIKHSPGAAMPIEFEVQELQELNFTDWDGCENAIELCENAYSIIEVASINVLLEVRELLEQHELLDFLNE